MITIDPNMINKVDHRSKKVIEHEKKEEMKRKTEEILEKQKKKMKKRLKNKQQHDLLVKEFNKNMAMKKKMKAMIDLERNKHAHEKTEVKRHVKILSKLTEDFNPELYINENSPSHSVSDNSSVE